MSPETAHDASLAIVEHARGYADVAPGDLPDTFRAEVSDILDMLGLNRIIDPV